jgi:N-acetylglucosaminyldiphosphoundecaprenol N-acetyl-beta-D-mannosaminyltransferase
MTHAEIPYRVDLFGIDIDAVDLPTAARILLEKALRPERSKAHYVVTPNVDHVVKLQHDKLFLEAYRGASLVVADGRPVVLASRLLGCPLPGTVPGSDLVPALFDLAVARSTPLRVYLFGAKPGVADVAAENIRRRWGSTVDICGAVSPEFGFEKDAAACARHVAAISEAKPDVLIIGLGAPKQEIFALQHGHGIEAGIAICAGATIDFIAGNVPRAPAWMRTFSLEWVYRLAQEPRRLWRRYLTDLLVFPRLVLREAFRIQRDARIRPRA